MMPLRVAGLRHAQTPAIDACWRCSGGATRARCTGLA
jgi:hypothetical protein